MQRLAIHNTNKPPVTEPAMIAAVAELLALFICAVLPFIIIDLLVLVYVMVGIINWQVDCMVFVTLAV